MKKLLLILSLCVILFSSCASFNEITINGIPGLYTENENNDDEMTTYIRYEIADIDYFLIADSNTIWLQKAITNYTSVYSLTLLSFRTISSKFNYLDRFIMEIDGVVYTLIDPDPYQFLFPKITGAITRLLEEGIQSTIDESVVKRIINAKSPIIFKIEGSDPIVIEGEQLQNFKQFTEGLLTINSGSDLGM